MVLYFIVFFLLLFGMIYFFVIRPVRQRESQHDQMVTELEKGEKVITASGMYGEVDTIDEDSIVLKVESGARIRVAKGSVIKKAED